MVFSTNDTERARIDSSGNLGLGVTPSAWSSLWSAEQFGQAGSLFSYKSGSNYTVISNNSYAAGGNYQGTDARYTNDGYATAYVQNNSGQHLWLNAASGTAGVGVTFTQAMTLDASGNLLIGRTSGTGANLDVYESASNDATIRIGNVQNAAVTAIGKQGASSYGATSAADAFLYSDGPLSIMSDNASGVIKFSAGGNTERARITSGGVLDIGTGAGAVGQIQFPATQVASSNANTLDDYEEGTWTATLTDGTNTTTSDGATYRKIGSLVFISFQFYNKNISAWNAANLSVTGLPFTVATNHDSFVTANTPNGFTVSGPLAMGFSNSSTSSGLYYRGGSSNWAGVQKGDITNNSNFSLYLSACYTAS
jgi:hypothetical protein